MAVTPLSPVTLTGLCAFTVVPLPNAPLVLFPQHLTVPLPSSAQANFCPASTAVAPAPMPKSEAAAGSTASMTNETAIERTNIQARENDGWHTGVALLVPMQRRKKMRLLNYRTSAECGSTPKKTG